MNATAQIIQVAIVALLGGIAIPLLVQLFITARTVQRVSLSLDRKLDETRRELHELLAAPRRDGAAGDMAAVLASAAVPAVVAAVRAFRASAARAEDPHTASNGHTQEKTS